MQTFLQKQERHMPLVGGATLYSKAGINVGKNNEKGRIKF